MKLNICLFLLGTVFLIFTGVVMYSHIDDAYYRCDSYNCTYTYSNHSCQVEVLELNYICTQIPCNNHGQDRKNQIETCYMPKGQYTCPTQKCYTMHYALSVSSLVCLIMIACAFLSFILYHLVMCITRCRHYRSSNYSTLHNASN